MKKAVFLQLLRIFSLITFILSILTPSLVLALPTNETEAKICQTEACKSAAQNFKDYMDTTIDPCDNFYQHVCQNWRKQRNETSPTYFHQVMNSNDDEIRDFIHKDDTEDEPEIVHRIRKIYSQCLNQDKQSVLDSVNELLQQIINIPIEIQSLNETENFDYIAGLAKFSRKTGMKIFFEFDVKKNPYDQSTNTFVLQPPSMRWRTYFYKNEYNDIIGKDVPVRSLANRDEQILKQCENSSSFYCQYYKSDYVSVPEFLIEEFKTITSAYNFYNTWGILYANKNSSITFSSNYAPRTLQNLQDETDEVAKKVNSTLPVFNWTRYIEELFGDIQNVTLDLKDPNKVEIITIKWYAVRYLLELMHLTATSPEHIKYLIWYSVFSSCLDYIENSSEALKIKEEFCYNKIVSSFGTALTYAYSTKPKYKKAKIDIHKMFGYIKQSTKERMQQSSWLDERTKEKALKKLDLMKSNIVYPNFTKSSASGLHNFYGDVNVARNFFETMLSKDVAEYKQQLSTLNQPNDLLKDSGTITPNLVNAFYQPKENSFNIPAVIIKDPVYNVDSLSALNYGAIGFIVANKLSYGLDSHGRQFNEIGNLEDWWPAETVENYKTKGKCFVKAYETYVTLKNTTMTGDSKVTLDEDISNNEGFKSALFAYRKYVSENGQEPLLPQFENYTNDQFFTLSFTNLWCQKRSYVYSVNGVLMNSDEFAEIWKCPKGSNMNPNAVKCSIW